METKDITDVSNKFGFCAHTHCISSNGKNVNATCCGYNFDEQCDRCRKFFCSHHVYVPPVDANSGFYCNKCMISFMVATQIEVNTDKISRNIRIESVAKAKVARLLLIKEMGAVWTFSVKNEKKKTIIYQPPLRLIKLKNNLDNDARSWMPTKIVKRNLDIDLEIIKLKNIDLNVDNTKVNVSLFNLKEVRAPIHPQSEHFKEAMKKSHGTVVNKGIVHF